WCLLIKSYWDAVSREISSFEEIVETHNFIELGKQIAKLKGTIDMAFLKHKELIETKIRSILNDIPEFKNQLDCKVCKKVNKERNKLDKYLEKKNDENCKEETNQTIINYIVSRREFISSKIENMLEGILMRNRFSIFIDRTLEKILSTWEKLLDEKKLEEAANKIWRLLRDKVSAENEDFINEEIDNIVNEEYGTMWTSNFFNNYKFRIIPELSNID
ncbi:35413_t:CDS:2, partial [Gigaspora margarita]